MDPLENALAMSHEQGCAVDLLTDGFRVTCHYCRLSWPLNFADLGSAMLFRSMHLDD